MQRLPTHVAHGRSSASHITHPASYVYRAVVATFEFCQLCTPCNTPRMRATRFGSDAAYHMRHRAPGPEGAPAYDLTKNQVYPKDVYQTLWEYRTYHRSDADANAVLYRVRGRPEARLTICRAVPKGVKTINPGDWVSIAKAYAIDHGKDGHDRAKDMPVICARTEARNIHTDGNSLLEWGYNGSAPLHATVAYRPRAPATAEQKVARRAAANNKRRIAWMKANPPR